MTDDQALHLVRNPWGHQESVVREARLHLCDRFEELQKHVEALQEKQVAETCACSHDQATDVCLGHSPALKKCEHQRDRLEAELEKCEHERGQAQRIAHLALDVEGWLFRIADALTDTTEVFPEYAMGKLNGVYSDMVNARTIRSKEEDNDE